MPAKLAVAGGSLALLGVLALSGCSSSSETAQSASAAASDASSAASAAASDASAAASGASGAASSALASASAKVGSYTKDDPVLAGDQGALRVALDGCNDCTIQLQASPDGSLAWESDPVPVAEAMGPVWVIFPTEYAKAISIKVTSPAAPGNWGAVLNYDNAAAGAKVNAGAMSTFKEGYACFAGEYSDNKGTVSLMAEVVKGPGLAVYSLSALPASGPANPVANGAMAITGDVLSCK